MRPCDFGFMLVWCKALRICLVCVGVALQGCFLAGATSATTLEPESDTWLVEANNEHVALWADRVFGEAVKKGAIDAASVALVRDGQQPIFLSYGDADSVRGVAATADTPFRSGSISKLFTAISILQLVDRGILSLDDTLRKHLRRGDVHMPAGMVHIRDLLTHSGGFDERFRNTLMREPTSKRATEEYMVAHAHEQVLEPGKVVSYSNYAMALAGLVVEDASGMLFDQYVRRHIFDPLNMEGAHTAFPGELPERVAKEHDIGADGERVARDMLYKAPFFLGSGGFYYSARDMAKFMSAVLNRSTALLSERSWDLALSLQLAAGEGYGGGIGLGFWLYETRLDEGSGMHAGIVAGHSGGTEGFRSQMILFPELRMGLHFVVVSSSFPLLGSGRFSTWQAVWNFLDHFRGLQSQPSLEGLSGPSLADFSGVFFPLRRAYSGREWLLSALIAKPLHVHVQDDMVVWRGNVLRRIGERSFEIPHGPDSKLRFPAVMSFSEDKNTVWLGSTAAYERVSKLNPINHLAVLLSLFLMLSLLPALHRLLPGVRPSDCATLDICLALGGVLAILSMLSPLIWILLGDHWRVESPRYQAQTVLATSAIFFYFVALRFSFRDLPRLADHAHGLASVSVILRFAALAAGLVLCILLVYFDLLV